MKIGLLDIDCHAKKKQFGSKPYPNIAIAKIAAWHKQQGDDVEWATPFEHYDILYRSKIFNFSEDDRRVYSFDREVRGGTGYDIHSSLPDYIDDMQPDLSIYPNLPKGTSYGFTTRGCDKRCIWCVVSEKEGHIRPYWDIDRVANGNKNIVLMDNNILAAGEYGLQQLRKIIERGYHIDFNQALDARLVNEENAKLLAQIKWLDNGRIRFGCDTTSQIDDCERAIEMINKNGFKGQYFLYTMIHGKFKDNYTRIMWWWHKEQERRLGNIQARPVYAYAQPYRDPHNPHHVVPQWQKDMASWVNKRQLYASMPFEDYQPRKGFRCEQYFNMDI